MLVFGHTGITLVAAALLAGTLGNGRLSKRAREEAGESSPPHSGIAPGHRVSWLTCLASRADIRFLLIGSLLPDIIDKPVGQFFFRETFSSGRIFCHTLLFLIFITVLGGYLYLRYRQTWGLALSFGTLTHLLFDQMWRAPQTLFWPLLGLAFERIDIANWIPNILHVLLTDPAVYLPELAGAIMLGWFAWLLVRRGKVFSFLKYGQVQ